MKTRKQRVYRKRLTKRRRLRVNNKGKNIRNRTRTKTLKKQKRIKGGDLGSRLSSYFKPREVSLLQQTFYPGKGVEYKPAGRKNCNLITKGTIVEFPPDPVSIYSNVIIVKPDDGWAEYEKINYNQICDTFNRVGELMDPNKIHRNSRSPKVNINTSNYLKNPTND
tara:strand:+ start:2233 stop:2730 length:498 start_codon:yes stop_codon:yes gene_type:complete